MWSSAMSVSAGRAHDTRARTQWGPHILPGSNADRSAPVLVFETSLQKAPMTFPSVSMGRPQRVLSPMPVVARTPGNVWPDAGSFPPKLIDQLGQTLDFFSKGVTRSANAIFRSLGLSESLFL